MSGTATYGIPSPALGVWAQNLQPASWRGVPFAVRSNRIKPGRRQAPHDYPYRDVIWVEDLGRGRRGISFTGFLVGDDVYAQRDAMLAACDAEGSGQLVHPSLGTMTVSLMDVSIGEDAESGRTVSLELSFLQSASQAVTPSVQADTQGALQGAASDCDTACGADYWTAAAPAVAAGEAAVNGVVGTVTGFVATVIGTAAAIESVAEQVIVAPASVVGAALATVGQLAGLVNDAAISAGALLGLPGYYGRYADGNLVTPLPPTATVASQLAAVTTSRAAVQAAAIAALTTAAANPEGLPAAVQGAVAALVTAVPSPGDQLRLLAVLAGYSPGIVASTAPIGAAIATAQTAAAALIRRAACAALGRAAAAYQPSSSNDAIAQLDTLTDLLDAEAIVAADAGDDDAYTTLRSLQTAVTADLLTRGAQLPQLMTVTRARPLPALVLAWQLYGDATRADDLVARADPVNSLFMPTSFEALSS